jgi:hypothetical protein
MSGGGGPSGPEDWRPTAPIEKPGQKPGIDQGGGGGGGGTPRDACDIIEATTLNSPNRTMVATLRVGDILDVDFRAGPPRQLLAIRDGAIAGSITSPKSAQIIQCITRNARAYLAEVRSIRGRHL